MTKTIEPELSKKNRILILGGDGFCGWPTALYFSRRGCDVIIVDNLSRRRIDEELDTKPLSAIATIDERIAAWAEISGQNIEFINLDLAQDYDALCSFLVRFKPTEIIHFGEQRSAPYSSMGSAGSRYTVNNNINATHNVLAAMLETGCSAHLVHLGTIGVYGYSDAGMKLPEGYLSISATGSDGRRVEKDILYPTDPVSIYHLTKAQDQLLFAFYATKFGMRITDLHQGVVWGTQTEETRLDPRLINRFDYDPIYGTVVNRFLLQAAAGHPLTVYGTGEQTRAYIHLQDTLRCIELAVKTPPKPGQRVRVINQVAETCSVGRLAGMVAKLTGATIRYVNNPRSEPPRNDLDVERAILNDLGQVPLTFESALRAEIDFVASMDLGSLDREKLMPASSPLTTKVS